MLQAGRFGWGDIRAWRSVIEGSHLIADAIWSPRLGLVLDAASGDKNAADPNLQTFNAMFQSGMYSGRAQLLGPSNSIRLEPSVTFAPARQVLVSVGLGFYWRQSVDDALYGIPGQVVVPSNGVTDRYEGSRPIVQIDWRLTRHLSAHVNCIYAFNGRFEERSVHATPTMSYVSPWVTRARERRARKRSRASASGCQVSEARAILPPVGAAAPTQDTNKTQGGASRFRLSPRNRVS